MSGQGETFIYSGDSIPIGGRPGDVLLKIQASNYYTAWRDFTHVFDNYDVTFDEGEY
jgi:hypothetical protein